MQLSDNLRRAARKVNSGPVGSDLVNSGLANSGLANSCLVGSGLVNSAGPAWRDLIDRWTGQAGVT